MSWVLASTAASVGMNFLGANSSQNAGIRASNKVSFAEGQAIVKERLNTNIRNSYSTAINQMNLALTKRKLSTQVADIYAGSLQAKSEADLSAAATGSVGASIDAATSDIAMKTDTAISATFDEYEVAVQNYNNDLKMMVLNTKQSEPSMTPRVDNTSSTGSLLGQAVLGGAINFASSYAMRRMQLGLGPKAVVPSNVASIDFNNVPIGGAGIRLGR